MAKPSDPNIMSTPTSLSSLDSTPTYHPYINNNNISRSMIGVVFTLLALMAHAVHGVCLSLCAPLYLVAVMR